jgi:hypothetical protein
MNVFSSRDLLGLIVGRLEDASSVLAFSQTCRAAARAVRSAAVMLRERHARQDEGAERFICFDAHWRGRRLPNRAWWGLVQIAVNHHRVGSASSEEYYAEQPFGIGGATSNPELFEVNAWQHDYVNHPVLAEAARKALGRVCYAGFDHTGPYPIDHPDVVAYAQAKGLVLDPLGLPVAIDGRGDVRKDVLEHFGFVFER